jgi:hypothetical protein
MSVKKKSVPDDLWPEPWPKMWQKFDNEGIVHKEFVPPGHTVNGKFYCEVLRQMRSKRPAQTSRQVVQQLLGPVSWKRSGSCTARCAAVFGFYKDDSHPPPASLLTGSCHLWFCPIPEDHIEAERVKFREHRRDPDRTAGHDDDTDIKWLPAVLLIMEILLELLYQCRRGLFWRGWRWIEISLSG